MKSNELDILNRYIDHTLLKANATPEQIKQLCEEAKKYNFYSVCVNPGYVNLAASQLNDGQNIKVCSVVGFPLGANTTAAKVFETKRAILDGALEVDMVMNLGEFFGGHHISVTDDIKAVVMQAKEINDKVIVKVILESCMHNNDSLITACEISKEAGADFVKTSTGFFQEGATLQDIDIMRKTVGVDLGVKASGGIRDYAKAMAMLGAGANRIGTSSSVRMMQEIESLKLK